MRKLCAARFSRGACGWPYLLSILAVFASAGAPAMAAGSSISLQVSSERNPDDFADIFDTVYKVEAAHSFTDDLFVNGFFEVQVSADGGPDKDNLEGNAGYQARLADSFSVFLSGGLGGRFTEDDDFAYYVLRAGGTVGITEWLSWNVVTLRYRDGFQAEDDYKTPRLTTKAVIRLDDSNDLYGELYRNFDGDWHTTANAFAVGYSYRF